MSSHGLPGTDVPTDFIQMLQMAEMLAEAELFVPAHLHGKPADILALMMRARGMDIPLAMAWDELYATGDGDVGKRAKLQRALARRAGHRIDFVERDRFHAVALVTTADGHKHEASFTIQEAMERGYTDPSYEFADAWTRMPEDMLVARVTTRAINWFCPEVLLGMGADLADHADDPQNASQVVVIREERRAQVLQLLRLVQLADKQPNGSYRLGLLRQLFMECRDAMLLDYGTDETGMTSVRHVLTDAMRAADRLAADQSSGVLDPADPEAGPKTVDDLRGLLGEEEAPVAAPDPEPEPEAEAAPDPEPEPAPEPVKKPRKRAAKKPAPKKATEKQPDGMQADAAGASGRPAVPKQRDATSGAQGSAAVPKQRDAGSGTQDSPAARPVARSAARPAVRPDDDRLPCGCLTDDVIVTGVHCDACTDRPGEDQ